MLAGQTSVDVGELAFEKGARVALHDQRPPRERDLTLRDYVLAGCGGARRARAGAVGARDEDGRRRREGDGRVRARRGAARARRRLELARPRRRHGAGPGLLRGRPRPPALHVLRRPAHARVARPRARVAARPPPARRADEPPRHRVARVAGADPAHARHGDRHGGPRPLVPGDRRHGRPRARGRPRAVLPRHLGAVAPRGGRAGDGARPRDRQAAARDRADGGASSSASATRRPRRARPSRGSRRWTRSIASSATPATTASWASRSRRWSARAASSSR